MNTHPVWGVRLGLAPSLLLFALGVIATAPTETGCNAISSPVVKDAFVDLGKALCISESASLDVDYLSGFCGLAADIVRRMVAAKIVGIDRVAAVRAGRPDPHDAGVR